MRIYTVLFAVLLFLPFGASSKKQKLPKDFMFIPSSTVKVDSILVSHNAFYMLNHEVTNFEYRTFLNDLKKDGNETDFALAYPDTSAWLIQRWFMQPMANLYFWHPAYDHYPVVNISKQGVELYCEWLTKEIREIYGETINDVRLPSKYEWVSAARGGSTGAPYPWGTPNLQNAKGCALANYLTIGDQNITKTKDGLVVVSDSTFVISHTNEVFTTATVKSYTPNPYGLYNMSGNVAEMTASNSAMGGHWHSPGYDIRITSEIKFDKGNPFVGFRPVITHMKPKK